MCGFLFFRIDCLKVIGLIFKIWRKVDRMIYSWNGYFIFIELWFEVKF